MNFGFSEEQTMLREEVRKFLDEQCPMEEVRRIMKEPPGYSPIQWKALAELGWTGLIVPGTYGGAGLGWVDLIVLLEETGRSLFPSPLISTLLTTATISELGTDEQKERMLPALADGTCIGALAIFDDPDRLEPGGVKVEATRIDGGYCITAMKPWVVDAGSADLYIVGFRDAEGALRLACVEADHDGVSREIGQTLDETKRIGTLHLESVLIPDDQLLGDATDTRPAIQRLLDRGAVAVTAETLGAGEGALALTVQYAKDRVQFGSPIGRYQGVKHPLAEIYVDLESLKSLLYYAAWALDHSPEEVSFSASKAKAFASETIARIGVDAIQLHGAVGYTEEYDVQLYLKRSKWARTMYGDEDHHLDRVASLGGL